MRRWQKYQRVINPLGEVGTVEKRLDSETVRVRYDNGRSGIAYDTALIKPWPENDKYSRVAAERNQSQQEGQ